MRFNKLDLNLLVALDHLLNLRSVSGAAARMNMTQSAMSNALLRLREYFGDDLLVKIGRRMELTPRGEALKDAVRDVLVRVEWTIATTADFDPARSDRQFNVLVSDYTLATLVPKVLALCRMAGSTVRFNFLHQVDGPEQLLERGDVDLLIIPKEFCSRQHPFEIILEEEFCAIVWSRGKARKGETHSSLLCRGIACRDAGPGRRAIARIGFLQAARSRPANGRHDLQLQHDAAPRRWN